MSLIEIPMRHEKWKFGLLAVGLTALALVSPSLGQVGAQDWVTMVEVSALVVYALMLVAGVYVYLHWRTTVAPDDVVQSADQRLSAWLTVGLMAVGTNGLLLAALPRNGADDGWLAISQLALVAILGGFALQAGRVDLWADPAFIGWGVGLGLVGLYLPLSTAMPFRPDPTVMALLNSLVILGGLLLSWMVLEQRAVSLWLRRRLAVAGFVLTSAHCLTNLDVSDHSALAVLAIVANVAGATLLWTTAHSWLRRAAYLREEELRRLKTALTEVEAGAQGDQELLHEVGSTIAGIASASRVMRFDTAVTDQRRQRLEEMLESEIARLQRMMSDRAHAVGRVGPDIEFDLDAVLEPLVVSHESRGLDISWRPSGLQAWGRADDLAEVVDILLDNARRHAPGATVRLEATTVGDAVEIACSDDGPGISAHLREDVFTSGLRGPASEGQGLGLAIARRLMSQHGGSLELAPVPAGAQRTTFAARLPQTIRDEAGHGSPDYVSH